jgi:phosphopantothenate synthetase
MHGKLVLQVDCSPASRACHESEIIIVAAVSRRRIVRKCYLGIMSKYSHSISESSNSVFIMVLFTKIQVRNLKVRVQESSRKQPLKMGPIGCPRMSVTKCDYTLLNIPES